MRRDIWFISDWHFGHEKIIFYCNRPFKNSQEQTETLIKNHNKLVKPNDIVYVLGDVGFNSEIKTVIPMMHGVKILILGNHDKESLNFYLECGFAAVLKGAIINIGDTFVSLSHYPCRNKLRILRLFWTYTKKMWSKNRSATQIWQRLKREWKMYFAFGKFPHLHGHTHFTVKKEGKNINVCVDAWDYKPVNSNDILNLIRESKATTKKRACQNKAKPINMDEEDL